MEETKCYVLIGTSMEDPYIPGIFGCFSYKEWAEKAHNFIEKTRIKEDYDFTIEEMERDTIVIPIAFIPLIEEDS